MLLAALLTATLLAPACDNESPLETGGDNTLTVVVGQKFEIPLETAGPGQFISPPSISSTAVRFDSVTSTAILPQGVRQRFWFQGVSTGLAIIAFHHSYNEAIVTDTVNVR